MILITSVNQNPSMYQLNTTTVAWSYALNKSPKLRFSKTYAVEVNYKSKIETESSKSMAAFIQQVHCVGDSFI